MLNRATFPVVEPQGSDDTWWHVRCPECRTLCLVSRHSRDGDLCECDDFNCMGQWWIGLAAQGEKRELTPSDENEERC